MRWLAMWRPRLLGVGWGASGVWQVCQAGGGGGFGGAEVAVSGASARRRCCIVVSRSAPARAAVMRKPTQRTLSSRARRDGLWLRAR